MSRTKSAGKLDNKRGRKSLNKQLIKIDVDKTHRRKIRKEMKGISVKGISKNQLRRQRYKTLAEEQKSGRRGYSQQTIEERLSKKRRLPGPTEAKKRRIERAQIRQAKYNKLSFAEKVQRCRKKEASGISCKRELRKLLKKQETQEKQDDEDDDEDSDRSSFCVVYSCWFCCSSAFE